MAARGNGSSLGVDLALILILLVFALATIFWNPLVWKSLYKGLKGHPMPEKSAAASALRWYTWISLIVLVVFAVFVLAKMM